jgi:hypothetical protein
MPLFAQPGFVILSTCPAGQTWGETRMSRFAIFTTLPYQDRAIVNLDAIAVVTAKSGSDGIRSAQLQMLDGSRIVTTASLADLEQVLKASPQGPR